MLKIEEIFESIETLSIKDRNNLLEKIKVKYDLVNKIPSDAFLVGEGYSFWLDDTDYDEDVVLDDNYVINLFWDKEAYAWVAISDDMPLVLESSDSIEILIERVKLAVPELLSLNKLTIHKPITLSFIIKCEL